VSKKRKHAKEESGAPAVEPQAAPYTPSGLTFAVLAGLGALAALWALFQWGQLLVVRAGGSTICSVSATLDCKAVWSSPFASAIHSTTGLPVAGWGLCWGIVAMALPLWALANKADGRKVGALWAATMVAAAAGLATVVVMFFASLDTGKVCPTCLTTYAVVIGYGVVAWRRWSRSRVAPWSGPAIVRAAAVTVPVYLLLLIPGLRTPASANEAANAALDAEAARVQATDAPAPAASPGDGGDVAEFLDTLSPELRQGVSDARAMMFRAPQVPMRAPRALLGDASAPLRVTDFTDVLCSHCAELHRTLAKLRTMVPPDVMSIEARHFPLDGGCNASLQSPPRYPVRCLAAKAQICLESHPQAFEFSGSLFENQEQMSEERVYELAAPYVDRAALEACVASPETAAKLADDVEWAAQHDIDGTPLVLINGRKTAGFGPFIYALALAKGDLMHPGFSVLPPPGANAHMH